MNRVYKVIWSKAKHCYVVTSEIARSVTKSASSARSAGRKGAAVLAMAALLFTAGGVLGEAANVVTDIEHGKTADVITVTIDDSTKTTTKDITINNVANATKAHYAVKANKDSEGNVIKDTYATKEDVKTYYVQKAEAQVTNLYASGDVKAGGTLNVGDGKFIVDTAGMTTTGDLTVKGDTEMRGDLGVNGNIKTNRGFIQTGGGNINTQGGALRTNGGNINAGSGLIRTTGTVKAGDVQTGTLTTSGNVTIGGALTVNGKLNMDEIYMTKDDFVGDNDVTAKTKVAAGEITAHKTATNTKDHSIKESAIDYDENSTSTWARATDADGNWNQSTLTVEGSDVTSKVVDSEKNSNLSTQLSYQTTEEMSRADGKTASYLRGAVEEKSELTDGDKKTTIDTLADHTITNIKDKTNESIDLQRADQIASSVTDGTNTTVVNQYAGSLIFSITDEANKTSTGVTQTATDITNTANNGTIANKALDVETDAASSIVSKVSNDYGSNTSTQLSHQTTEEMKAEGKTAFYLRGAAEEKSQLTDGDKKTTIDTVAGQTNTNITEGKNVSNSLQKADQIASSVTDGTNTTVVNQDAKSLASSITDGAKANNTNNTVDKSEQLIKVDDTHFYAETRTAGSAVEALKSDGNTIISAKDAVTGTVSSAVTDGATITGISQNAKDISLSAAGGTITNDANDVLNKGANSVINEVGANQVAVMTDSVKAAYGSDTYTTWDDKGITNNAKDKTVATNAKDILNTATGDMTNTVGGKMLNDVTGDMENKVGRNLTNSAAEIENSASKSITDKVGENTSWKMTNGKISESIVNGTASNKENTTAEGTKRIITNDEGTGTYNQTATSNNISLKNAAGDPYFTKSESLNGEKTSVKNTNGSSTINQSAESIVNFVKNSEGTTKTEQSAVDIKNTAKNGTITNDAKTLRNKASESITDKVGENVKRTMTTDKISESVKDGTNTSTLSQLADKVNTSLKEVDGEGKTTKYLNNVKTVSEDTTKMTDAASGAFSKRSQTVSQIQDKVGKTTVTITNNGLAVTGGTTTDTLTVTGTSEFRGKADFKDNVSMGNDLAVKGETRTGTLHVEKDGYVGGNLNVAGNIETHDAVLSADSRQVVTGRQLYQTNERVDRLDNRIKKVGANAAALAALRPGDFNPDDKFSIAAGFGSYRNANAAALGLFYRPNENVLLSLGTSFGDGENMVNAGVSVKFGRGKSMAERRKEMADEVSSMRDEMRSQDERIAELEEMLKKQSELIEKLSKES